MAIGKNKSPLQTFPRDTRKIPKFGDADLLPKGEITRPSKEQMPFTDSGVLKPEGPGPYPPLEAPDIASLPWRRTRGNEWTTESFRALVLDFIKRFFRDRPDQQLIGWDIDERANGERMGDRRLPPDQHFLLIGVTQRTGRGQSRRVEVAVAFPIYARQSPEADARLAQAATALDAQL